MKKFAFVSSIGIGLALMLACSPSAAALPDATTKKPQATATILLENTAIPSITAQVTTEVRLDTPEPASFPLTEPGHYFAGNRVFTLVDQNRADRKIEILIQYPALKQTNADGRAIVRDADPDVSGAPYPLILTEENSGRYIFLSHLATHGFVLAIVESPLSGQAKKLEEFLWIEPVRDFLLTIDQIASNPPDELDGQIDSDHVGFMGYSYGGDISLALSGARLDPEFYLSQCEQLPSLVPE